MVLKFNTVKPVKAPPTQSVRYFLHKTLAGPRPGRSLANIHASDVTNAEKGFCGRERLIAKLRNIQHTKEEWLSTSLAMTFSLGNMVQDEVVNILGKSGVGYADWSCINCNASYPMSQYPVKCLKCEHYNCMKYKERRFVSAISKISCGVDAFAKVDGAQAKMIPIEVKTIDKEEFKKLAMPLVEHRIRTKLYLKIMSESTDKDVANINLDKAIVLYVSKGGFGCADPIVKEWKLGDQPFSPFKEYVVERNDSEVNPYEAKVMAYHQAMQNKIIPDRICHTPTDGRAYKCACAKDCFSGSFPAGKSW